MIKCNLLCDTPIMRIIKNRYFRKFGAVEMDTIKRPLRTSKIYKIGNENVKAMN